MTENTDNDVLSSLNKTITELLDIVKTDDDKPPPEAPTNRDFPDLIIFPI